MFLSIALNASSLKILMYVMSLFYNYICYSYRTNIGGGKWMVHWCMLVLGNSSAVSERSDTVGTVGLSYTLFKPLGLLFSFVPAFNSFYTHASLLTTSVSLSYITLAIPMRYCS